MSPQPGTIGVCANDTGRFTGFAHSLCGVQSPNGSKIAWAIGSDIAEGREILVRDRMHGDWMWFMDDDHAFAPDTLMSLLAHGLPVVAPVVLQRQKPFLPVSMMDAERRIVLADHPSEGLVEVYATGTAGMLIRRSVFEAVEVPGQPIFEKRTGTSDDYLFCAKLRELGIPIHVDLGLSLGHITTTVVWPDVLEDDQRVVTFQISDSFRVSVGYQQE
jgi:hypothetical protein